ncbi:MAG: serine/threonine-protein phosphatase, partial [Ktedonobacteraceae bacterium]|nr:serine/threonine-protein phosphatase [Ktedonobacteraceae bacterium]
MPLNSSHSRALAISEAVYRALLLLYPRSFRLEYGREMLQTFRTSCRETLLREGHGALLCLWWSICYDLLLTTAGEHLRALSTRWKSWLGIEEKEFITMSSVPHLNVALLTDIGMRAQNEDSVTSVEPQDQQVLAEKGSLFIVADGMGGHTKGELASKMAVEEVSKHYYDSADNDITAALSYAIKQANATIYQHSQGAQNAGTNGMGTTCIAAVVRRKHIYIANVGDSRAYLVHEGHLRQVSEDHSLVAALLREGKISP